MARAYGDKDDEERRLTSKSGTRDARKATRSVSAPGIRGGGGSFAPRIGSSVVNVIPPRFIPGTSIPAAPTRNILKPESVISKFMNKPRQETNRGLGIAGAAGKVAGRLSGITPDLPSFGKSLQDYIDKYGDGSSLIGEELAGVGAREAHLKSQAGLSDEAIAKIYAQLQNSMGQAGTEAGARYDQATQAAQQNTAATQANIAASRNQAASAQSEIAKNLGMTDVPPSSVANHAAVDGANAQSALATTGKSQVDYLSSLGQSQRDFYQGNQAAAGFRGAEARTALQGDLTGRLAELEDERQQMRSQAKDRALALAQAMYSADYGQFNDQRNYRDSREDLGYDRGRDQFQMESDYAIRQAETAAANRPEPAEMAKFQQIEQQLQQAMPQETVNAALAAMANAKEKGAGVINTSQIPPEYRNLVLQWGQEYLKNYNY